MRSADEIAQLFKDRLKQQSPLIEMMRQMRDQVNGDIVIPLPEMEESQKPAVANLIAEAGDQTAMRVSSTMPHLFVPPLSPRNERSREKADRQRKALLGYWEASRMKSYINRKRARFLAMYGIAPVVIRPSFRRQIPVWQLRNPLHAFPSPSEFGDELTPVDCIFGFRKPLGWLRRQYPDEWKRLFKGLDYNDDTMFELVEYIDEDCIKLVAVGVKQDWHWGDSLGEQLHGEKVIELEYIPNRAGICTVVTPPRITLDRLSGQFNQLLGMYEAQARLVALELIAVEKGIFPDTYVETEGTTTPVINSGTGEWYDGREGRMNIIKGGRVGILNQSPGFKTGDMEDRLERSMRSTGAIPAQWGGEVPTNVRTGRAGEVTMSATVDFRIQEYQETLADSMVAENKRAIKVAKAYFGDVPQTFHVEAKGGGDVDFIPNRDFEVEHTEVVFPMPGADANGMVVAIGQRLGIGTMSRRTAMELDPLVKDPDLEEDLVVAEGLRQAQLASLQQMAAGGAIPPNDLARIEQLVLEDNVPLYKAVQTAQEEAQARQAQQVAPTDPMAQPGLAMPGAGAEAQAAVEEPDPSLFNLQKLLMGLRQPESASGGAAPEMVAP